MSYKQGNKKVVPKNRNSVHGLLLNTTWLKKIRIYNTYKLNDLLILWTR